MSGTKVVKNPIRGFGYKSDNIPDGIPAARSAAGGAFPTVTVGTADRWVISTSGTLPAPVGTVKPGDFIVYDGATRTKIAGVAYSTLPSDWSAAGGVFPTVVAGIGAWYTISVAGTLPAPVGSVIPGDWIVYSGSTWSKIIEHDAIGIPTAWDATAGLFPTTVAGVNAFWIITVAGTLPAPIGGVVPGDTIVFNGSTRTLIPAPASVGAAHIIEDEGTPLTQRAKLNFTGTGVTATDNAITGATDVTIPLQDISGKVDKNTAITGATKTKITYDAKGLVTGGADATTADIAASTDKNYVTDAQKTVIQNTSGTNSGNETVTSIATINHGTTAKTTLLDADEVTGQDSANSFSLIRTTWTNVKVFLKTYFDGLYGTITALAGKKPYHGVLSRLLTSPLPTNLTTTTFTLAANTTPITYYYQGTQVVVNTAKTATLDDGLGGSTTGLYYVYFNAATGNILATKTFPGISNTSNVIISIIYRNGTNYGICYDERHAYDRDCERHQRAHDTIGTRYESGLGFSFAGTTIANTTFAIATGSIHDEDIDFTAGGITARIWYQNSASTYAFDTTVSTTPYKQNGTGIQAVNSTGYGLVTITAANRYFNFRVYASTSNLASTHIFCETVANADAGGYTSVANARAVAAPSLSGFGLAPEYKLLYRVVVNGVGLVQTMTAADDYRTTSTVSGGALTTVTASSVTENNYGNVQTAINTLIAADANKLDTSAFTDAAVTGKLITGFSSGAGTVAGTDTILQAINKLNGNIATKGTGDVTTTGTQTLTNKRITPRVLSAASYTTDTGTSINGDTLDMFIVTAQTGALKFNNPSGSPTEGQKLIVRIKDNGTARALTYDTQYRAMGVALPSTTVLSKTLYMGFIFNNTDTKRDLVAVAQEA